ncbi:hypothetical protein [Limnohabitans sp.]|uniref:hypothetical protein n=1 Tax=Limnohabitans sp. TaxID=1907725 RepID=UPI0025B8A1DC|nr:hypothetical protein [Limnohabitans sp.]
MTNNEIRFFRIIFIAAAIWNLCGGVLGYFNTGHTFMLLFDRSADDPLLLSVFKGATGTTLTYFIGYLIVAFNPLRHTGIVIVGGIGKVGFAIQMLKFYMTGLANANALIVVVGDMAFCALFLYYFFRLIKTGTKLI